jgi:hypothetical protein
MENLSRIDLSELHDLLAQQTNRYMKMLFEGATKLEFDQCRESIISIQAEIQSRRSRQSQGSSGQSNTSFGSSYAN